MEKRLLYSIIYVAFVFVVTVIAQTQSPDSQATRPRTVTPAAQEAQTQQPQLTPTPVSAPTPSATRAAPVVTAPASAVESLPTLPAAPLQTNAPLQPARPLAPNKARAHIVEAREQLKARLVPTALSPSIHLVTLAALDPDSSKIHLLTLPKQTFLARDADVALLTSRGMSVRLRVVRPNYVNTAVVISDLTGRQLTPLLVEYPIEKQGRYTETAYYT
ncbi:MAG: hypothetical protein ACRD68_09005, partial [Pyrinomonadaceae bacterium]